MNSQLNLKPKSAKSPKDYGNFNYQSLKPTIKDELPGLLLNGITEGVIALDSAGRIISINAAAGQILNIEGDHLEGLYFVGLVNSSEIRRQLVKLLSSKQRSITQQNFLTVQGRQQYPRHFLVNIKDYYGEEAEDHATVIYLIDRTCQFKELSMKKIFFTHMTHELRTPINVFMNYIGFLEMYNPDDDRFQDVAADLKETTHRLKTNVENMVTSMKLCTAYQPGVTASPTQLTIHDQVESLSLKYKTPGNKVSTHYEIFKDNIYTDPFLMGLIIYHLFECIISLNREYGFVEIMADNGKREPCLYAGIYIFLKAPQHDKSLSFTSFDELCRLYGNGEIPATGIGTSLFIIQRSLDLLKARVDTVAEKDRGCHFIVNIPGTRISQDNACLDNKVLSSNIRIDPAMRDYSNNPMEREHELRSSDTIKFRRKLKSTEEF